MAILKESSVTGGNPAKVTNAWFVTEDLSKNNCTKITFTEDALPEGYLKEWNGSNDEVDAIVCRAYGTENKYEIKVNVSEIELPANSSYLFSDLPELKEIEGLNLLNWSNVTNASGMFCSNPKLIKLNLKDIVIGNGNKINMIGFLFADSDLQFISLPVCSPTHLGSAFRDCVSLQQITNFENVNTEATSAFNFCFMGCSSLRGLNLKSWKISDKNEVNTGSMFGVGGKDLTSLCQLDIHTSWLGKKYSSNTLVMFHPPVGTWETLDGNKYDLRGGLFEEYNQYILQPSLEPEGRKEEIAAIVESNTFYAPRYLNNDTNITYGEITALADGIRNYIKADSWMTMEEMISGFENKLNSNPDSTVGD